LYFASLNQQIGAYTYPLSQVELGFGVPLLLLVALVEWHPSWFQNGEFQSYRQPTGGL
jgi:hypothetical protein